MILINYYVCKVLNSSNEMIYRIQEEKIASVRDEQLCKILNISNNNRAIYSTVNKGHSSLDLQEYTHFSSPIRRLVDKYIHELLKKMYFKDDISISTPSVEKINDYEKRIKKLQNDVSYIKLLNSIDHDRSRFSDLHCSGSDKITHYFSNNKTDNIETKLKKKEVKNRVKDTIIDRETNEIENSYEFKQFLNQLGEEKQTRRKKGRKKSKKEKNEYTD